MASSKDNETKSSISWSSTVIDWTYTGCRVSPATTWTKVVPIVLPSRRVPKTTCPNWRIYEE